MREHPQGRQLAGRADVRGVAGCVVERVRRPAAARGELDRLGDGDDRRIEGQRARPAQDPGRREGLGVQPDHDGGTARGAGERDDPGGPCLEALELREPALDLAHEIARGDVEQPVPAGAATDRDQRPVGQERVRRAAEDPGRVGELRLHRGQRLEPRAVHEPIQVPPAAPVGDEVQRAVRGELGLDDRFVRSARGQDRLAEGPVRPDRRDPQAGRVPGHVGVVPLEPGEPRPVRGDARRRDEVGPRDEDARVAVAVERHVDDLVDRLALAAVILADRDEAAARGVEPEIGVAPRAGRRDRDGGRDPGVEPVEPAVGAVGEGHDAAGDGIRAAAVLVDPGPDRDRRVGQVRDRAVRGRPDQDPPAGLGRAALEPVDVVPVEPWLGKGDQVADEVVHPDRAAPRSVRRDLRFGHPRIRCRAATRTRRRPARRSSARARCRARPA